MPYRRAIVSRTNRNVPQTEAIPGREHEMVRNNAGGMSFTISPLERLTRFIVLGTEGGSYYVNKKDMTIDNAEGVLAAFHTEGVNAVNTIVDISHSGRAAKNDAAIFALAMAASYGVDPSRSGDTCGARLMRGGPNADAIRKAAFDKLSSVARTGTHIMQFADYMSDMRGWGHGPRRAVSSWFTDQEEQRLAYQAVKYRQRGGWMMRDLMRLGHPNNRTDTQGILFDWIAHRHRNDDAITAKACANFPIIDAYVKASQATSEDEVVSLIEKHNLPHECVPNEFLKSPAVWRSLVLNGMPLTALLRNLTKLTEYDVLNDIDIINLVASRLTNENQLRAARVHPFKILNALATYRAKPIKSHKSYRTILAALDASFYAAFRTFEPAGKRFFLGLDISGSMSQSLMNSNLSAAEGSAAMALVTMATEQDCFVGGFAQNFVPLDINPHMKLNEIVGYMKGRAFGSTNPSAMFRYAIDNNILADTFVVYTDNEAWSGPVHVTQALDNYRDKTGINSKLIAVGMTATRFSVVDPKDELQLNVVGFDTETPTIITEFSR